MGHLLVLFLALIADRWWGEPDWLWSRIPHPVVLFGKVIKKADTLFNLTTDDDGLRYRKGAFVIALLVIFSALAGWLLDKIADLTGPSGLLLEGFIVFVLLAQKSLLDHVNAVASGLRENGTEGGRRAVSMIVGRDPSVLDTSGVSRAAIETLGENFSDGVVAPAFWYAVFGLPGIIAYKMINTADSMIGYRNERYLYFGRVAAQIDDMANWVPARLSAVVIAVGALFCRGIASGKNAIQTAFRDAGLHRSPNAGWPEAALAGACGFALGGPRQYSGETVQQAHLNGSGRRHLGASDIDLAITVISCSGRAFAALALIAWAVI